MAALLNLKHETAAQMIAEDRETDQQIAAVVGVSRRTIEYWKHRPEIQARIAELCEAAAARMQNHRERHEWLWERHCLRQQASTSKSPVARSVAVARLQEMGTTSAPVPPQDVRTNGKRIATFSGYSGPDS